MPLVGMELANRAGLDGSFPLALFALLWALAAGLTAITISLVKRAPAGLTGALTYRIIGFGLLAWLWIALLVDQMPCFLGVPNCD